MAQNLMSLAGSTGIAATAETDAPEDDDVAPGTAFNLPDATVDFSA